MFIKQRGLTSFILSLFLLIGFIMFMPSSASAGGGLQIFKTGVHPDCEFNTLGGLFGATDELLNCEKDEDVHAGEEFFVLVQVRNFSESESPEDVIVIDDFPDGWQFLEVSGSQFDLNATPADPDVPITCAPTDSTVCENSDPTSCIRCQIGDLDEAPIGGIIPNINSFLLKFLVNSDFVAEEDDGSTVAINNAYTGLEGGAILAQDSDTTIVQDWADLKVTKVCKPDGPLGAGQQAQCFVNIENLGTSDSRNVQLTDTLFFQAGINVGDEVMFTLISATATMSSAAGCPSAATVNGAGSNQFVCNFTDPLPAGGSITLEYTFVSSVGTDINNVANVTCRSNPTLGTPDPDCDNNMAQNSISFDSTANLSITKTSNPAAGTLVGAGTDINYMISVSNAGPSPASNVTITDVLPDNVIVNNIIAPSLVCFQEILNKKIVCVASTNPIPVGGPFPVLQINVTVLPGADGILQNVATISSDTIDPNLGNNISVVIHTVDQNNDIEITKEVFPDPTIAGELQTAIITVTNKGPDTAGSITVRDDFEPGLIFIGGSPGCNLFDADTVACLIPAGLGSGQSVELELVFRVPSGFVVTDPDGFDFCGDTANIFRIGGVAPGNTDGNLFNNTDSVTTFCADEADLKVTKVCKPDLSVRAGEPSYCDIIVENLGPSDARDVEVTDVIESDGQFGPEFVVTNIFVIPPAGGTCNPAANFPLAPSQFLFVQCDLEDIPATTSGNANKKTVRVEFVAQEDMDINDVATVDSLTPDPNFNNNMDEGSINVDAVADLAITKSDNPDPVIAGNNLVYTIDIINNGPSTAENVVIEDFVPPETKILTGTAPGGACNVGTPGDPSDPTFCGFDSLAPGDTRQMTITVQVKPDALGNIFNNACVSSDTLDIDNSNDCTIETTTVNGLADLVIEKTIVEPTDGDVTAGDPLNYLLTVTNEGPSKAQNVIVTDDLPDELIYQGFEAVFGVSSCILKVPADNIVECDFGMLDPGQTKAVKINTLVPADLDPDTITNLFNCAVVNSDTADPDPDPVLGDPDNPVTDNQSCVGIDTTAEADLWMEKDSNFPTGNPSGTVQYFCTVHNDGGCSELPNDGTGGNVCGTGGPSDAESVVIRDYLPSTPKKVVFQFASQGCFYSSSGHYVQCEADVIPYGDSVTYEIQVDFKGSFKTDILNTCTIESSDTTDPDLTNQTHTIRTVVQGGTGDPGGPGGGRGRGGNNGRNK